MCMVQCRCDYHHNPHRMLQKASVRDEEQDHARYDDTAILIMSSLGYVYRFDLPSMQSSPVHPSGHTHVYGAMQM